MVIMLLKVRCIIRDLENNTETHYVIVLVICVCVVLKNTRFNTTYRVRPSLY